LDSLILKKARKSLTWVKIKEGAQVSLESIEKYVKNTVSKEKEPHHYKSVKGFPMTRSGKVQKFKLAEMAKKEYIG